MADVLLTVGVNPNLDFSQFEKDLNAIFAKYEKGNKHTINLGFALDKGAQGSLQNVDNILSSIRTEAASTVTAMRELTEALQNSGNSGAKGVKKMSAEMERFQKSSKAIDTYFATLKKLNSLKTDIQRGDDGVYKSQTGKWSNLANELNQAAAAYSKVGDAIKSLPAQYGDKLRTKMSSAQSGYNVWFEEISNNAISNAIKNQERAQKMLNLLNKQAAALESRIQNSLTNYSAGRMSSNRSSRDAYKNILEQLHSIRAVRAELGRANAESGVDFDGFKFGINNIDEVLRENTRTLRENGDARKTWSQGFKEVIGRLGIYFTATQVMMTAIRSMKAMVREAIAVEDAMVQMRIVTKSNASEMEKFGSVASKVAKQTASSVTDIVDSATVYARLGYNMDEATNLAKYTSMISKVGDIDVASVQSAVTAIVKAFKIDAGDVMKVEAVFDKMIETGNNLPVSVAELAEGLNNAGSALAASGASYEQSLALLAASNATVQNISKSSTGLRTIVARIRNTKTELDELGESMTTVEYDAIVKALTDYNVSMTDEMGNIRNPYEILKDIAAVAKDLNPNDYAALAKTLAGTRIQNVFYSLIDNFGEAEKAMSLMGESTGALDNAFAVYSESISAHIQQFKTQFQDLSSAIIGSGLVNNVIDLGTGFLSLATSITKAGGAIPALIAGFAAIKSAKNIFASYGRLIKDGRVGGKFAGKTGVDTSFLSGFMAIADDAMPNLSASIKGIVAAAKSGAGALGVFKAAATGLWAVLTAHPVMALVGAITAIITVFDAATVSAEEARDKLHDLRNEYSENESKIESLNGELDITATRINELLDKASEKSLSFADEEELANLREQNEELERRKSILEAIQAVKQGESRAAFVNTMEKDVDNIWEHPGWSSTWGSEGPMFFSDRHKIDQSFSQYHANLKKMAGLDIRYKDDLANETYLKTREGLERVNHELANFLIQKGEDFADAASGISYIPNPTNDTDRAVNEWIDYIGDYQDRMNILLGGDKAKEHAFGRIIGSPKFDETTKDLKELGKQGAVTAEMLADGKYTDFLNKLVDVGVISDTSADSLTFAALAFNGLSGAATDAGNATEAAMSDIKKASKDTIDTVNGITEIQKILASQEAGKSISLGAFTSGGVQEYASALEYVNGVYKLNAEKVNELVAAKVKLQQASIAENKALAQSQYLKNAAQIRQYRDMLAEAEKANDGTADGIRNGLSALEEQNDSLKLECDQYSLMSSALTETTNAYNTWLNTKSSAQTGDMFDGALAAVKQINDTLNNEESDMFGRIGRTDYKAAVDFIVPDSVDAEDTEAVNSYLNSISNMFTFDKDDNRTGLNIDGFLEQALNEGLVVLDESGESYRVAGGKTMEDFAEGLNLSLPLVRAMFGELGEFGAKFSWADEASQTIGDLGAAAYESAEALRSMGQFRDMKIVMDVSEFDDKANALKSLDKTIKDMQGVRLNLNPDIDQDTINQVDDVIKYCVAQKQLLEQPAIMTVDVSRVTSEIAPILELLQQFQGAQETLEMKAAIGADTSSAESELNGLVAQIQSLEPKILTDIGLSDTSKEGIATYIAGLDANAIVSFGVDSSLVDAFEAVNHTATGEVTWYDNTSNLSRAFYRTGYVTWRNANSPSGTSSVNRSARVNGTALARGDWRTRGGKYLMGELGQEIVVDPNTGMWYTVGDQGAEFVNLPEGAIVFNHVQSQSLLANGSVAGRGAAKVNGSAMVSGTIPGNRPRPHNPSRPSHNYHDPSGGANDSITDDYDKELAIMDWIEIAIDRIERVISRLRKTAESAFKSLSTKAKASCKEIETVAKEIELQQSAYDKYISAAESVSLSSELKMLVRNGAIDISQYDKDTKKLIDDYQDLYEKALDCADSIDDLNETLSELYKNNFDDIQNDFENKLALMERSAEAYDKKISMTEELGYMQNADHYRGLQDIERNKVDTLNAELIALQRSFDEAMNSGTIEEGSDAWYEMKLSIEDTKLAISDAELELVKYNNTLREIEWSYFDRAQERVSEITSEADFLLGLMDGKDMFDKNGNLSSDGVAVSGLHAEKYGVYMAQADKYAEEIKRIDKEIAKDPNNQKLIDRKNELLEAQRDSILMAKSEKEAMVDLVREGIQIELDAVRELIDAYNESLSAAKDLHDYQKRIADKTSDIATLEKQLAAYQNDASEESRSKIQKIQMELADAREDLKEAEYNQYVSEQRKMLDELYSEYEEILNARFDNLDETFEKLIEMVNKNFIDINEHLAKESKDVGYSITEATQSVWANGGHANGVVSKYGDDISSKLTGVGIAVDNIFGILEDIARNSGVSFGNMKGYSSGGLVNYTGLAMVHGSGSNPEMVLDANDTKNFIMLRDALRNMAGSPGFGSGVGLDSQVGKDALKGSRLPNIDPEAGGYSVGEINVTIPIDHIDDYNDFVNQLRNDKQFEQMIQSVTIGRLAGKSKLDKNKYRW